MREIIFRGKSTDINKWVYGFYAGEDCKYPWSPTIKQANIIQQGSGLWYEVDPKTVGQYTGLTDKNGVKIFEGDILSCDDYPYTSDGNQNYYAKVVWLDENAAFGLYTFKNPTSKVRGVSEGCDYVDDFESDVWEVIGNIYDNPELLGGDSDDQS